MPRRGQRACQFERLVTLSMIPAVIDNQQHRLGDVLNELLARTREKPFDVATAYFSISGYRIVEEQLNHVGAFRLLLGSTPTPT